MKPQYITRRGEIVGSNVVFDDARYTKTPWGFSDTWSSGGSDIFEMKLRGNEEVGMEACGTLRRMADYRILTCHLKYYLGLTKSLCWIPIHIHLGSWDALFEKKGYLYDNKGYLKWGRKADNLRGTKELPPRSFPTKDGTGVYLSKESGLLAYYPTLRSVKEDRPVQIKPGRYLKKFFPGMTDDEIRKASALCTARGYTLKTYSNWKNMLKYYKLLKRRGIVESCMAYDSSHWHSLNGRHPLEVYHDSDVQLAVMFNPDEEPVARALFNKNNKEYPMIYGQWERMEVLLTKQGYKHGDLDGADINKIELSSGPLLMPYIDGHRNLCRDSEKSTNVDVYSSHCTIQEHGEYRANRHSEGYIEFYSCECEHCSQGCDETFDVGGNDWCQYCVDNEAVEVYVYGSTHAQLRNAENDYILIGNNRYEDDDATDYHGYVYSEYHGDYISTDDSRTLENGEVISTWADGVIELHSGWYWLEDALAMDWDGEAIVYNGSIPLSDLKAHYDERPDGCPEEIWDLLNAMEPDENPLPSRHNDNVFNYSIPQEIAA